MRIDELRVRYVWFNTEKAVFQVVSVHMFEEQAELVNMTLQGILDTMKTISGSGIGKWQMHQLPLE